MVGKDGRFLGWTSALQLINEPEIIKQVLETGHSGRLREVEPASMDPLRGIARAAAGADPGPSMCDIIIRHSPSAVGSKSPLGRGSQGEWRFNKSLAEQISMFWEVPLPRIIIDGALPEGTYDIVALHHRAESHEFREIVRRLIEVTFELSVTREKRAMEAYVLRPLSGREPKLEPPRGVYRGDDRALCSEQGCSGSHEGR
jgi:hypothetical protein